MSACGRGFPEAVFWAIATRRKFSPGTENNRDISSRGSGDALGYERQHAQNE